MPNKIQFKRGLKANLPSLGIGEPAFCTDTKEFYVGDGSKNISIDEKCFYNILNFGGNADGVTPNDSAFTTVKAKGKIYFPQNSAKNAKYYFTDTPTLDNLEILADDGVILSLPNNFYNYKSTKFGNEIAIESRDRLGTDVKMFKNTNATYYALSGGDIDPDFGEKNIFNIAASDIHTYAYNGGTAVRNADSEMTISDNMYTITSPSGVYGDHYFVSIVPKIGIKYDALYKFTTHDLIDYVGVMLFDKTTGAVHKYALEANAFTNGEYIPGGTYSESSVNTRMKNKMTDNKWYWLISMVVSFRLVDKRKFEFYINDVLVDIISTGFDIKMGGFLLEGKTGSDTKVGKITGSRVYRNMISDSLNIAYFGDSISQGNSSLGYTDILKDILVGKAGVNKISFDNFAIGGQNSTQQLAVMQTKDLSSYDVVCILIGTNDFLEAVSTTTFYNNIVAMLQLAITAKNRVVIGLTPPSMSYTNTEIGWAFYNSEFAAEYNQLIRVAVGSFNSDKIVIAETTAEIGRLSNDNWTEVIHDNIHYKMFGEIILARAFARGILKLYSNKKEENDILDVDLASNIVDGTGNLKYRKINGVITFQGYVNLNTAVTTNSHAFVNIPTNIELPTWIADNYTVTAMCSDSAGTYGTVPIYLDTTYRTISIHAGVRGTLTNVKMIAVSMTFVA